MDRVFITGASKGLGLALAQHYLEQDKAVYNLSRGVCPEIDVNHCSCDLADLDAIPAAMSELFAGVDNIDLVVLNAGILGQIQDLADTPMDEVRQVMDINLWANKVIVDWLVARDMSIKQIVFISSGASVNGNRGWGAYSISKAAVNMMAKLYAAELPDTHICAFAPGIIQTQMQDYLCKDVDTGKFNSIQGLVDAYGTEYMPTPEAAAEPIAAAFERCLMQPSGSFLDIRQME